MCLFMRFCWFISLCVSTLSPPFASPCSYSRFTRAVQVNSNRNGEAAQWLNWIRCQDAAPHQSGLNVTRGDWTLVSLCLSPQKPHTWEWKWILHFLQCGTGCHPAAVRVHSAPLSSQQFNPQPHCCAGTTLWGYTRNLGQGTAFNQIKHRGQETGNGWESLGW